MNILVTGANGQLGNEMRLVSKSTNDNYTFTDVGGGRKAYGQGERHRLRRELRRLHQRGQGGERRGALPQAERRGT